MLHISMVEPNMDTIQQEIFKYNCHGKTAWQPHYALSTDAHP
jgi:uncharacterized protein YegL